jgi:hypothetical protein
MKQFSCSILRLVTFCGCCLANLAPGQGAAYSKIEASFNITGLATDPFDYTVTDVRVQIVQPDSSVASLPAFFDGGTTWRVRHTPMAPGLYQVNGVTLNGQPLSVSNLQPPSWLVSGLPTGPGFVRRDPANASCFIFDDGRRYFPVGHNVAWWTNNAAIPGAFYKMGAAHENWSRVWMMQFYDSLNLEWPKVGAFGQYSLPVAQKWDAIVNAADQNGIHFQMTLQHHGQYSTNVDSNWADNPYNSAVGGFLSNATQFFTDTTAKALTKRKYRYIVARWGYSPGIMAWELFNEVQFTDAAQNGQWSIVGAWHDEMAQFIRSQDPYQHLITTSSEVTQPIWNQCDYYQHHDYPSDLITALRDPQGVPNGQPVKPIFGGECGLQSTVQWGVNAPLWAGLMSAQTGISQPWYWDRIEPNREYGNFRAVSDFVAVSGVAYQESLTKSIPTVTGGPLSQLSFAPGGGWSTAAQDTFTVGSAAPDGIGSAPNYLQGDYHRSMTPNGYTFLVNYGQAGTFSVQVLNIAASGAGLRIQLDSVVQTNIAWPGTGSDASTNFAASIAVPAGAHTIKIDNPGLDWINLGNITLNPYVPLLAAYAIGNTNFNATWIWHRTNVYRATATSPVTGTVAVGGLRPGTYSATWWDTFAGTALSNFSLTVPDTNAVTIATPSILRSAALYVGAAPDAGLDAPSLIRTLGTNSPPLSLPIAVANRGGLPLTYSLCVTGVSPVAYAARNSTQSGGPVYAWRDLSGFGRDITTNFTALAAPKTSKDEGIAGPFDIGFSFPFFSGAQSPGLYTNLYVSPNGFVTFSPFAGDRSTNAVLPGSSAPTNLIAFFWDDLDLTNAVSHIYTAGDAIAGTFTVQFQNVRFKGSTLNVNCELILKSTGEILMQYQTLGVSNACTVGLQNAAANAGFQVAYNQNYLQTNFAVRLTPTPWFSVSANAGVVPNAYADTLQASLGASGIAYGTYSATLLVNTGDPIQPLFSLPVTLSVTPIGTWRQTHFGSADNSGSAADTADPDGDGLINILEYAFNQDPWTPDANPISFASVGGHLTVTFNRTHPNPADLTYIAEVTDDLGAGTWNSGPTFTSESVLDNGDGTETVTVTDLTPVGSTAAHFLRIRIVH